MSSIHQGAEARLRRSIRKLGYGLRKSRSKAGFEKGPYYIVDEKSGGAIERPSYPNGMTLEDVEHVIKVLAK